MSTSLARSLDRLPSAGNAGAVRCLPQTSTTGKRGSSTGTNCRAVSPSRGRGGVGNTELGRRLELLESCVASNWQEFSSEWQELRARLAELTALALVPRDCEVKQKGFCDDLERRLSHCERLRASEVVAAQALGVQVSELRAEVDVLRCEVSNVIESKQTPATPRGAVRAVERTEACVNEEMRRLQGEAAQAAALAVESAKAATARSTAEGELSKICFGAERDLERIRAEALGQAEAIVKTQWLQLQAKTMAGVAAPATAPEAVEAHPEPTCRLSCVADKQPEILPKSFVDTMQVVQDFEDRMDQRMQHKHAEQIDALLALEARLEYGLQSMHLEVISNVKSLQEFTEKVQNHNESEVAVVEELEKKIEASSRACRMEASEATNSIEILESSMKDRWTASHAEIAGCIEALAGNTKSIGHLQEDIASALNLGAHAADVSMEEGLASKAIALVEKFQIDAEKREEEKARAGALEGRSLHKAVSAEIAEVRKVVDEACAATAASARSQAHLAVSLAEAESAKSEAKIVATLDEALERLSADSVLQAAEVAKAAKEQVEHLMSANEERVVSLAASARCLQDELGWLQQDVSAIHDCHGDAQNRVDGAITTLTDCLAEEVRETRRRFSAEETAMASEHCAMRRELEEQARGLAHLECDSAHGGHRQTLCRRLFPAEEDGRVDELHLTVERVAQEAGRDIERCEIWARRAHRELESELSALYSEFSEQALSLSGFESHVQKTGQVTEATCAQVAELTTIVERFTQHVFQNEMAQSTTIQHTLQSEDIQYAHQSNAVQHSLENITAPVPGLPAQARAIDDAEVLELASVLEQLCSGSRKRDDRMERCAHKDQPGMSQISPDSRFPPGLRTNGTVRFLKRPQTQLSGFDRRSMPWQDMEDIQSALGRLQGRSSPTLLGIPAAH